MALRSLVYVSSAAHPLADSDLLALLRQSREKNARLGLTGMLLYKDGNFIQLLEGPPEDIASLYSTIAQDPRHHGILVLLDRPIAERTCPDWSMGFYNLADPALRDIPGYSEFMNLPLTPDSFRADPSPALRLLELFRKNMNP